MKLNVALSFDQFFQNIRIPKETVDNIRYRYKRITKQLNIDFYGNESETANSLYVGSYGRNTDIVTSDIDMLFVLPYRYYEIYNRYQGNGQSALLQKIKASIQKTYSKTYAKADGQVLGINFTDGIDFEIVPCFKNIDGSYTYPDTNNGGSWKVTNPKPEIAAVKQMNDESKGNMKALCRMARAWKYNCSVPMGGLLIDTLAYNFLKQWEYKTNSSLYHDWMSRDFFLYLSNRNPEQPYYSALGSNQFVHRKGNFEYKAKQAYNKSLEAIKLQENYPYSAKSKWREIYGTKFPS